MANNNDASVTEKVTGTTAQVAGKATQAGGTAVEAGGRATQATGATVEAAGKATEVAGKGMQVAGKGVQAAGKGMEVAGQGIDAGGQAMMQAGNGLSATGLGAIAGVPLTGLGAITSGAGKGTQIAGKGTQVAGKGMETAGKGVETAGKGMNKAGRQIRKTGGNIAKQGKDIRKQGKDISDQGKDIKEGNSVLNKSNGLLGGIGIFGKSSMGTKLMLLGAGAGCGLQGLIIIILFAAIFAVVSSVAEALSPVTDFFSSLGHWFAGDGWCPNEVECAKKAESDFYTKVEELYDSYLENDGVELDTEVLTAGALYNRFDNFNGVTEDSTANPEKDTTAKNDEEKKDAYKEGKDRLEQLAKNMVSEDRLDYMKFKQYLVNTYIPKYYEELYNYYSSEEQNYVKNFHANAIISFSKDLSAYDALLSSSFKSKYCSAVIITDETGEEIANMKLDDYVGKVVETYGSNLSAETQKALAISIRTYVIDATDYCDYALVKGTTSLDYSDNISDTVKNNVEEVSNLVMYYYDETFSASFDYFTGTCDSSTNKCQSSSYKKIPSDKTHTFTVDTTKVSVDNNKISGDISSKGLSIYGAENMSVSENKTYEEILQTFFADDITISTLLSFETDYIGGGGIFDDMLYPVGWPNKNGVCASYGWCYNHIGSWSGTCSSKDDGLHQSIDLPCGTMGFSDSECDQIPVLAAHSGVIVSIIKTSMCSARTDNTWYANGRYPLVNDCSGNGITIRVTDSSSPANGYKEIYWHFNYVAEELQVGSEVTAGQFLGYMGSTGNSTAPHLHFSVRDTADNAVIVDDHFRNYCSSHSASGD